MRDVLGGLSLVRIPFPVYLSGNDGFVGNDAVDGPTLSSFVTGNGRAVLHGDS